ncbi:hypothetical protein NM208_g14850 [Fusarium decemcellulare]|uniref:Uncharacterized protein n=1 Tax=Fusarium decemcellulare TaxID=57161 RepID=A0ACC1RGK4_9HYPO|nr:hypothetical protein NM208_g14850 [Fusarium decemcellulare]
MALLTRSLLILLRPAPSLPPTHTPEDADEQRNSHNTHHLSSQQDINKVTMPQASDWDNADFLMELGIALFTAAQANKSLPPPVKEAVEEYLKGCGYSTSFDAVRNQNILASLVETYAMAKRQTMQWDAHVHEDILICLFQHLKPNNQEWASVMQDLQGLGYSFSESALRPKPITIIIMSGKPARGWDATSHEDLLLAFMDEIKPNKAIITSVTEKMREKGYTYSYDAINQHVQKLRKNRDTSGIQNAGASSTSATTTPRKKATATPRKRATGGKKKSAATVAAEDDEDAEDEKLLLKKEVDDEDNGITSPSPAKRVKTTPKLEPEDEDANETHGEF